MNQGGGTGGGTLYVLGMLAATLLILLAAWFVTRWIGLHGGFGGGQGYAGGDRGVLSGLLSGGGRGEEFRVLARAGLSRDACLVLVRVGETCLLLGVSGGGVTLLREWQGEEAARWFRGEEETARGGSTFREIVRDALTRGKEPETRNRKRGSGKS